ncbi:OmpA family protein [Octadecabacter sp. G9-8]|uniref:OmpA family protein n=1 Tax=Octadecabacter dasysiphoniae TaxID=2909341 RepID=A0ABS9CV77_9RHOB|nr:OmpA family protein [Octadecabacter dasysiphoniae]MCF2871144.1 OmpA family protein [Octadecabacter dasysiphoniae]
MPEGDVRRLIGGLVLAGGVAALGYVASTDHATRIQATISDQATAAGAQAVTPQTWTMRVSGRDVTVSGYVLGDTGVSVLRTALQSVEGVRTVNVDALEAVPYAPNFSMRIYLSDGAVRAQGSVPTPDAFGLFPDGSDLTLAAGVPDENWITLAAAAQTPVSMLQSGGALLTERVLMIGGVAQTPDDRDAIIATLMPLPPGYTLDNDITVLDDGTPLRLTLDLRDDAVSATGKFPADLSTDVIGELFALRDPIDVTQSIFPAQDPDWHRLVRVSMAAASELIDAQLVIDGATATLTGSGTPDGIEQANARLAQIPDGYAVTADLSLWDDGAPLAMTMDWDGRQASATGKFPTGFNPRGPAGVAVTSDAARSFLPDTDGAFTDNSNAGVTALGLLTTGVLDVTADAIVLTGTAASPQVDVVLDSVFANLPADTNITRTITYLDDGSPAAWTLQYSATTGATVEGRLPVGLSMDDIASTLELADIDGTPVTAVEDDRAGTSLDTLTIAARYLPEVEQMTYARDGDGSALDLILSPGVDVDLVAVDLAETLPGDVAFSLGPLDGLPDDGTQRLNAATGLNEVFTGGFWLPDLDFTADVGGCTAASMAILDSATINFLSGSARLDATSIRAINGLAAVVRPCLDAGLRLEIGGHTDATGDADSNNALSFNRAAEVRAALIDRGATADVMTPVGYGQTDPIADNATPEGRAQNRRTTLSWTQP